MYRAKSLYQIATPCQQRLSHSSAASRVGYERKRKKWMSQELTGGVLELTCNSSAPSGICNVYFVGTVHDCPKSGRLTQAVVKFFKPEVVFLELCSERKNVIMLQPKKNQAKEYELWDGTSCGEFYLGNEEAMKYGGKITLMRYMGKASLLHMLRGDENFRLPKDICKKLGHGKIHAGAVDKYNELGAKHDPIMDEILVNERDQYMSAKLREVAVQHESVVAVIGMAHVEQLLSIPKQPIRMWRVLAFMKGVLVIILRLIRISIKRRRDKVKKI
ncbi:uncharacterized protein LOC125209417 [Salvia hispanica]|uniref:uncharacterized protein LOC125209417 n=1 Tax=Salvia hispanica TaxID=49212 RepID=UPI0020095B2B|nr:uncharacterized protein LOC125209417 [Salvia hispanica]